MPPVVRTLVLLLLAILPRGAGAESLVSTLSDDAVEITSSFMGERIVVFGAVRDVPSDATEYQVAVVVQGPPEDLVVRKKEYTLGIWANRTARDFGAVPSYYVLHLSENFSVGLSPTDLVQYRLGVTSLPFMQEAGRDPVTRRFARALAELKTKRGLYDERHDAIDFLAPNVFRTTFFLPSDVPTGDYRVSVYLFRNSTFLAGKTQDLHIAKGGTSQEIARAAIDYPLPYGLACVGLAVGCGWLAGVIFRRP